IGGSGKGDAGGKHENRRDEYPHTRKDTPWVPSGQRSSARSTPSYVGPGCVISRAGRKSREILTAGGAAPERGRCATGNRSRQSPPDALRVRIKGCSTCRTR